MEDTEFTTDELKFIHDNIAGLKIDLGDPRFEQVAAIAPAILRKCKAKVAAAETPERNGLKAA